MKMFQQIPSIRCCAVLVLLLLIQIVLSSPQRYNYYSYQQRINAQRVQAQRLQAQRVQAQNRYQQSYRTTRSPNNNYRNGVSRADSENAKFLGSQNQEPSENAKTANLIRRHKQPCYFRSADQQPAEGRFLWDLNVYNVYPSSFGGGIGGGCGGFGGGGGYYGRPFRGGLFQNFLSLFLPGGALNMGGGGPRPLQSPIQSDSTGSGGLPPGVQNDIDPGLDGGPTGNIGSTGTLAAASDPINGVPGFTTGQLVGGVASTVNGIIQQLAGNARPVSVYRGYG